MSNRLPIILVILAIVLVTLYSSFFVVNAREQAIVVRFGEIQDVKTEPGLYFKLPFGIFEADRVQFVDDRARRFDLDNIRVQVSGGKFYEVDAFVVYKITDAKKFRQTVSGDIEAAESRLRTRLDSALRRVYGLRGFEAALSEERGSMMREVGDQLRGPAESLGITIEDVRIRRTDLTQEVSQQTYERMKAERLAEAALIRARGTEAAQRIRAVADRQVIEIVSQATRDADVIRGEGEQEASRIYGEAYAQDPAFFNFYRSMNAYEASLQSPDTTLVLSPTSDFFRFFEDPKGTAPAEPGGSGTLPPPAPEASSAPAPSTGANGLPAREAEAAPPAAGD